MGQRQSTKCADRSGVVHPYLSNWLQLSEPNNKINEPFWVESIILSPKLKFKCQIQATVSFLFGPITLNKAYYIYNWRSVDKPTRPTFSMDGLSTYRPNHWTSYYGFWIRFFSATANAGLSTMNAYLYDGWFASTFKLTRQQDPIYFHAGFTFSHRNIM